MKNKTYVNEVNCAKSKYANVFSIGLKLNCLKCSLEKNDLNKIKMKYEIERERERKKKSIPDQAHK